MLRRTHLPLSTCCVVVVVVDPDGPAPITASTDGAASTTKDATTSTTNNKSSVSTPLPRPLRVAGLTVKSTPHSHNKKQFNTGGRLVPVLQLALLWRALDRCVVPAEQRCLAYHHARSVPHFPDGSGIDDANIPSALMKIDVSLDAKLKYADMPMLRKLTTTYPALVRSLRVLTIAGHTFDESADLGAFATLATELQALRFCACGITSVRGLAGRCEYLATADIVGCDHIRSLEGLEHRVYLKEVNFSFTDIASLEPLRTCPALTNVNLRFCQALSSLDALEGHRWLQEVDASFTRITSAAPLLTCTALAQLDLSFCERLPPAAAAAADHVDWPATVKVIRDG